ncbi:MULTISPECIES: phage holin family protein [unclassified Streptomyces]|uniref:phage holin family protein n=1 Tax=unclassified Streptomyces TaxID=2593676 RepID=UPI002255D3B2|nr:MULTISPECIES: phage holin family protein [unclassified Streptomyces]MCX4528922.1 phage holin family protein [Streptomyces sp. NBC_01551]MCX4540407.1 phage holin family protein [Streptomyces sp. NBC_01565]
MLRGRWRTTGSALLRVIVVWAVSTLTMLVLAGVLPDFRLRSGDGDSVTQIGLAAAWGAGAFGLLSALVWPLLVRALLLVPALVLGLLVFFLNGSLLLLALSLVPDGRGEVAPETAVVVAAVMSAVASATSTALAVRDDEAYRRRLYRLADRRRRRQRAAAGPGADRSAPGMLFLQLDGVGYEVLRAAAAEGLMPTVADWLDRSHRLASWRTDWSSQTGASQLGILHGSNFDVPAFRWYEKETGEVMVCNRPTSAAELQLRAIERTRDGGLLTHDGASRGNLFSGGADQLALVLSVSARRGRANRSRAGYFAYFSDPANAVRTALSFVAEAGREIGQSVRARLRGDGPRVARGGLYPLIRAFATVVERDVVVAAVIGDMLAGRAAVYADLVAYDEVAHHSGPRGRDTDHVLARLDRSLALLSRVAEHAPREYRIVLLSDHGQSPGETFLGKYGLTLKDLVRAGCGLPVSRRAGRTHSGAEARAAVLAALHRPVEEDAQARPGPGPDPVVLASGNLALISFPAMAGRAARERIERAHPALLTTLANHPGVGFLLVDGEVIGPGGAVARLAVPGEAEALLAPFGPGAAEAVRRTDSFPHVADVMVNSAYDPATGAVHAFEEQIGSHGGLGGEQGRPFLMWPTVLSDPLPDPVGAEPVGAELVGAEAVHDVLRRWLREADGPQVPLQDPRPEDATGGIFPSVGAPVQDENH